MNDYEAIAGLKERLTSLLASNFKGRPARMASAAGVAGTTLKGWFDKWKAGENVTPNALALFKVAQACGVTVEWLLTGKEPEIPAAAADSGEVERLRADLKTAMARVEALTNQLAEATREGINHARRALDLDQENARLKGQIISMGLGAEQMADVEDIHRALGLSGPVDVEQVLRAAATSFRAVDRGKNPHTVHEPAAKSKDAGDQGAGPEKRRRANSS